MKPEDFTRIPLFESMPTEVMHELSTYLTSTTLQKDEALFYKDEIGDALYIIKSGKIKISIPTMDGEELILAVFSDGDFFGELSVLDEAPRSADAVAMTNTSLLALHRTSFFRYLFQKEEAVKAVITALCQRLRKTDDFLTDICFSTISKRLLKKLVELINQFGK
ncbi:MAG: cyclic nucleotide-binding domain-containing protein, partial [Desulfohalobiaceae bacterium]|nr:cyclic nucleotide-binding domain-containing protein [Desulfohalobiaceae bacterium]